MWIKTDIDQWSVARVKNNDFHWSESALEFKGEPNRNNSIIYMIRRKLSLIQDIFITMKLDNSC